MKDDHEMKGPAQQQAAVMEQQAANQHTQEHGAALEENAAEQKDAIGKCADIVTNEIDRQSDRIQDCLEQAGAGDDLRQSAEQVRQDCNEAVASAADQADRLIEATLSENTDRDGGERQL